MPSNSAEWRSFVEPLRNVWGTMHFSLAFVNHEISLVPLSPPPPLFCPLSVDGGGKENQMSLIPPFTSCRSNPKIGALGLGVLLSTIEYGDSDFFLPFCEFVLSWWNRCVMEGTHGSPFIPVSLKLISSTCARFQISKSPANLSHPT